MNYYLYITDQGIDQRPFTYLSYDDLKGLVGDRRGMIGFATNYFINRKLSIVHADLFDPASAVTAKINGVNFQGPIVITDDVAGLTQKECDDVRGWINLPSIHLQ